LRAAYTPALALSTRNWSRSRLRDAPHPESEAFAYAEGNDERAGRYTGLAGGRDVTSSSKAASCCSFVSRLPGGNSASYVDPHVIFNVKGNDYRLVTYIDYERGFVVMKWFGTHADYDREGWK
jgi:mRNA-degrading endonuclease HigB of HigAB toxin-antitoxin module